MSSIRSDSSLSQLFTDQSSEESVRKLAVVLRDLNKMADSEYADLFFKKILLIIDANLVIPDLRVFVYSHKATALQMCLKHNVIAAIAPSTLESEVCNKIPEIARETGFSEDQVNEAWEQLYRPHIRLLDKRPVNDSDLIETLRDRSDAPYVQAYEEFKADAVLSADPDLKILNIVPGQGMQFTMDLRNYAEAKSVQLQVVLGGVPFAILGFRAIGALFKLISTVVQKYPVVSLLGLSGLVLYGVSPKGKEKLGKFKTTLGEFFGKLVEQPEIQELLEKMIASHQLERHIVKALPPKQKPKLLREYLRRVLADSSQPLTVAQIHLRIKRLGYQSSSNHWNAYLRRVLNRLPDAKRDTYGRWSLNAR